MIRLKKQAEYPGLVFEECGGNDIAIAYLWQEETWIFQIVNTIARKKFFDEDVFENQRSHTKS